MKTLDYETPSTFIPLGKAANDVVSSIRARSDGNQSVQLDWLDVLLSLALVLMVCVFVWAIKPKD